MTIDNQERMIELLEAYKVSGNNEKKDLANFLIELIKNGDNPDLIFQGIFIENVT